MELFNKNLELLRASQPSLARRVQQLPKQNLVQVIKSKDGNLIPKIGSISLHSNYYPIREARDGLANYSLKVNQEPVIYGLGFGYHVLEILKRYNGTKILVIDPSMSVFQCFMESRCLD